MVFCEGDNVVAMGRKINVPCIPTLLDPKHWVHSPSKSCSWHNVVGKRKTSFSAAWTHSSLAAEVTRSSGTAASSSESLVVGAGSDLSLSGAVLAGSEKNCVSKSMSYLHCINNCCGLLVKNRKTFWICIFFQTFVRIIFLYFCITLIN